MGPDLLTVQFGRRLLPCQLKRTNRQRTIAISVGQQSGIEVLAPRGVHRDEVRAAVHRKGSWIVKQLRDLGRTEPATPPRCFANGESILYLGKNYRLRLRTGSERTVCMRGPFLEVTTLPGEDTAESARRGIERWLRKHAKETFGRRIVQFTDRLGLETPRIRVRRQAQRWGSCTAHGEILLNWQLIAAPVRLIDAVLAHETAHLVHPRHTPAFWRTLRRLVPDYAHREEELMKNGPRFLLFD